MIFFDQKTEDVFVLEKGINNLIQKNIIDRDSAPKVSQYASEIDSLTYQLLQHTDPYLLLPKKTKLFFIKKIILRILKVYTKVQIHFNNLVAKDIQFIGKNIQELNKLFSITENLEVKILKTNIKLNNIRKKTYTSIYYKDEKDKLYEKIEEVFRGDSQTIKKRQKIYIPFIETLSTNNKKNPFLDIGFGRGEFIEILLENNVHNIVGVDTNTEFFNKNKSKTVKLVNDSAINFLNNTTEKFCGISIMHVLEHLTVPEMYDLLHICYQRLDKDGLLIIETPNPHNIQVSSYAFYFDPTHITKLPPELMEVILKYVGFSSLTIKYLSPFKTKLKKNGLRNAFYGAREYGIIAKK